MDSYRTKELTFLNESYNAAQSRLVILYGQRNIGKTTLLKHFLRDKEHFYYLAGEASERQQRFLMAKQLQASGITTDVYPSYREMTDALAAAGDGKCALVIDEFQYPVKSSAAFMEAVLSLLSNTQRQFLIILCSSSVSFIENQLVSKIGRSALSISAFLKIRELGFDKVREAFPDYSVEDQIGVYAILGGVPGYWRHFNPAMSLRDNICRNLLKDGCPLLHETTRIVMDELREGGAYYAILSALAGGKSKLGDIYEHTLFSRAKISVYLKNLMELELASKVFSIDTTAHAMQRKGVYRISNHFVDFLFRFLYPNQSMLTMLSAEEFYDRFIKDAFADYCAPYFSKICYSYMESLALSDDFEIEADDYGIFDGKEGYIDFLAVSEEDGSAVSAFCCYDKPVMPYEFYENALRILAGAKTGSDYLYLFAREGFDEKLRLEAKVHDNIRLLTPADFLQE